MQPGRAGESPQVRGAPSASVPSDVPGPVASTSTFCQNMKKFISAAFCVIWAIAHAEESRRVEMVRRDMVTNGWSTEGVTFEEIGRQGQPVLITRAGAVVGYYCDESAWERRDIKDPALDGVTRIVFGYSGPNAPVLFEIADMAEIAVWIAAYRNHTEFERRFGCFVPTSKGAGFEQKREEFQFGGGCLCSLALRFYTGDKEILELQGHLQDHEEIDSGMRNSLLHELAKAKLPKAPHRASSGDEEPFIDPFAEDPTPEPTKAEQTGAGQPATRPESRSEGNDKSQPKSEGRSR